MKKARFLASFLVLFALLLGAWRAGSGSRWYTQGLLIFAGGLGPMFHGWMLDVPAEGQGRPAWIRGDQRVDLTIQFDALATGLISVLALLAATPGVGLGRRACRMVRGGALHFLMGALIVASFPVLVLYKNALAGIVGTFLGLAAYVGAPAIIWFALSFRELRRALPSLQRR